jgi:hypothetical protein
MLKFIYFKKILQDLFFVKENEAYLGIFGNIPFVEMKSSQNEIKIIVRLRTHKPAI